jgi:hypothetical protein
MMTLVRKKPSVRLKALHLKIRCSAPPILTSISADAAELGLQIHPISTKRRTWRLFQD